MRMQSNGGQNKFPSVGLSLHCTMFQRSSELYSLWLDEVYITIRLNEMPSLTQAYARTHAYSRTCMDLSELTHIHKRAQRIEVSLLFDYVRESMKKNTDVMAISVFFSNSSDDEIDVD